MAHTFGAHLAGGPELRPLELILQEAFGVHLHRTLLGLIPWEAGARLQGGPLKTPTPGDLSKVPLGGLHGPPHTADVDMDIRVHQDMSEAAGTHAGHSAFL